MNLSLPTRRTRKDAQANQAHILDIAGRAFMEEGVEVSMDAIARRADIGSATLYRHFPNKDALLAALLVPHHEALARKLVAIEQSKSDTGRKLDRWIEALGDWMLVYDGLPEPLRLAWSATGSPLKAACDDLIEKCDYFLRAAQEQDLARRPLTGRDIFLGSLAVAWASRSTIADRDTRLVLSKMLKYGWNI